MSEGATHPSACRRVLVVDDDLDVLDAMTDWIRDRCDATVTAVASAEEAMASTRPESYDVCVLDYGLDGADGLTLGAMLREINPNTRLILVSGGINSTIESLAIEHGFGRVFSKPVQPDQLLDAIVG